MKNPTTKPTITSLLIATASICCATFLQAEDSGHETYVVISGNSVNLSPSEESDEYLRYPKWLAPDNSQVLVGTFPTTDSWQQGSLSFVPESDGVVSILLRGPLVRPPGEPDAIEQIFVDYDAVSIESVDIPNGSFEDQTSLDVPEGWQYYVPSDNVTPITEINRARVLEGDAADGSKYVRVWHNSGFSNSFPVIAGEKVTIAFSYRATPRL